MSGWKDQAEVAKSVESTWQEAVKAALKEGKDVPAKPDAAKPDAANPGPEPIRHRYALTDATVEKIGTILAHQPRGVLLFRDELAGWLGGMAGRDDTLFRGQF